jgi:glycosyltransferase involved in cell wall biosynthesis
MIKSILGKINKKILTKYGLELRPIKKSNIHESVVSIELSTTKTPIGHALLSYVIEPFISDGEGGVFNTHTHYGESIQIVEVLNEIGYSVDVVSFQNHKFVPRKKYDIFIGARTNFEMIAHQLTPGCIKIVHLDTAHWLFNNSAVYQRALNLQKRRQVVAPVERKILENSWAIEACDYAVVIGNEHTISTYAYAKKPTFSIVVPAIVEYPWIDEKDYDKVKNNFIWLGSDGLINKGLDLLLDAFKDLPSCQLTVCGPIDKEKRFLNIFYDELFNTPNIRTKGWVDVSSEEFVDITKNSVAMVYPSAAEGQAGSVVTCMHAGLIPIISNESGILDAEKFGIVLQECSIDEIKRAVSEVSNSSANELKDKSRMVWQNARMVYSRSHYKSQYRIILDTILSDHISI